MISVELLDWESIGNNPEKSTVKCTFEISGRTKDLSILLNFKGFRKVSITSCNGLESLSIDDALEELYNSDKYPKEGDVNDVLLPQLSGKDSKK